MRADDHLDAAREHARRAAGLSRWLDARRGARADADFIDRTGLWYRTWVISREDERQAEVHRGAADQLRRDYEQACAGIPRAEIERSPIERHGVGWIETAEGVTVLLSPAAGPAEHLLATLRCHRAWMMLGEGDMAGCLLDLPGLDAVAYGDRTGITVELSVEDLAQLSELQRRAAHELPPDAR